MSSEGREFIFSSYNLETLKNKKATQQSSKNKEIMVERNGGRR